MIWTKENYCAVRESQALKRQIKEAIKKVVFTKYFLLDGGKGNWNIPTLFDGFKLRIIEPLLFPTVVLMQAEQYTHCLTANIIFNSNMHLG